MNSLSAAWLHRVTHGRQSPAPDPRVFRWGRGVFLSGFSFFPVFRKHVKPAKFFPPRVRVKAREVLPSVRTAVLRVSLSGYCSKIGTSGVPQNPPLYIYIHGQIPGGGTNLRPDAHEQILAGGKSSYQKTAKQCQIRSGHCHRTEGGTAAADPAPLH